MAAPSPNAHIPGEPGVWVFILGDMCIFAILFATFLHYRSLEPDLFALSRMRLSQNLGVINTLLLLSSSWMVATALRTARQASSASCRQLLRGAWLCGLGFVIIKIAEYSGILAAGTPAPSNNFFMFYFVLTGIHLLHVLIGLAVIAWMMRTAGRAAFNASSLRIIEGGGVYWHMVDLLWVVLFALLYLLP